MSPKDNKTDFGEIQFRLTFDFDPTRYPDERPLVSVAASDYVLSRRQAEKFRTFLEEYCNNLKLGRQ